MKLEKTNYLYIIAAILYIIGAIFLYLGYDKKIHYDNSSWKPKNAYVNGDAYNFIINSNYSIGYYVLACTLFIIGSMFVCMNLFLNHKIDLHDNLINHLSKSQLSDDKSTKEKVSINTQESITDNSSMTVEKNTELNPEGLDNLIKNIETKTNCAEIVSYLENLDSNNESIMLVMTKLKELAKAEKIYGNQKREAIRIIQSLK